MPSINRAFCTKKAEQPQYITVASSLFRNQKLSTEGGFKGFDIFTMYVGIACEDRKQGYI